MTETAVIDRFEGNMAILLVGEDSKQVDVPRRTLPRKAREGDHLHIEIQDGQVMKAEIDAQATEAARQSIQKKLDRLRRGDHLK